MNADVNQMRMNMPTYSDKIQAAKSVNLLELIQSMGYQVKRSGGNEYCLMEHDSLKISNNKWYWHSQGIGGSAIDFAIHFPDRFGRHFKDAVEYVLNTTNTMSGGAYTISPGIHTKNEESSKNVMLPEKEKCPARLYAYLCTTRGIDSDIVKDAVNAGSLYQSKNSNNCVFVGKDADGAARYGFQRGTLSHKRFARDCEGSDKSYGFTMPAKNEDCNTVYVFESPIDAMSHATLEKRSSDRVYNYVHRLSLGGVSEKALERFLDDHPKVHNVVMCLDNDETGRDATVRIRNKLSGRAEFHTEAPKLKDYNEDLMQLHTPKRKGMTI